MPQYIVAKNVAVIPKTKREIDPLRIAISRNHASPLRKIHNSETLYILPNLMFNAHQFLIGLTTPTPRSATLTVFNNRHRVNLTQSL